MLAEFSMSSRSLVLRLLILVSCALFLHADGVITTIAGRDWYPLAGDRGPAIQVPLGSVVGIATDSQGNVYAVDRSQSLMVMVSSDGVLTVIAGNGKEASISSGDGGPAVNAPLQFPWGIAADPSGNVFVSGECFVRKIGADGIITTYAGNGSCGHSDSGVANQVPINDSQGLALDSEGNLFIAEGGTSRIRKVTPQGVISTVAGNGQFGDTADGALAVNAALRGPIALAVGQNGVIYFAEGSRIRRVGTDGILSTIAGSTLAGYSGDGGPATAALLNAPQGIAIDRAGYLYVADTGNQRVRKITADGTILTIAGTGVRGLSGDQGQASLAALNAPAAVAVDASANIYIADSGNYRIRKIDASGTITTYAGNGDLRFSGENVPARTAVFGLCSDLVVSPSGTVYVSDTSNNRIRKITPDGIITTLVGSQVRGFAGDGGPASQALVNQPSSLAFDAAGNLYFVDFGNARIRRIDPNGTISSIAGTGIQSTAGNGDGGLAVNATFKSLRGLAFDSQGNLDVLDGSSIRQISRTGVITTIISGLLAATGALAVDAVGNLYVAEYFPRFPVGPVGGQVARIAPDGSTTYIASNAFGFGKMVVDSSGSVYVPSSTSTVLRLDSSGAQSIVAGTGQPGFSGDDGSATSAELNQPNAVALDASGNLYIVDTINYRIRKVFLNPASGFFEPKLHIMLPAGYYTATVALGQGERPGYWGMEVLVPAGMLDGGLNLGGSLQQSSLPPGFGGFYLPSPQTVHIHVDARPADGGDTSNVKLAVRLLDVNKNRVASEHFGGTSVDFTQALPTGYYTVETRGGDNSPLENFLMSVQAPQLSGGVVVGGYAGAGTVGFSGFYLSTPQEVTIRVVGQPTYGTDGAGGVRLTLYDINRRVLASAP